MQDPKKLQKSSGKKKKRQLLVTICLKTKENERAAWDCIIRQQVRLDWTLRKVWWYVLCPNNNDISLCLQTVSDPRTEEPDCQRKGSGESRRCGREVWHQGHIHKQCDLIPTAAALSDDFWSHSSNTSHQVLVCITSCHRVEGTVPITPGEGVLHVHLSCHEDILTLRCFLAISSWCYHFMFLLFLRNHVIDIMSFRFLTYHLWVSWDPLILINCHCQGYIFCLYHKCHPLRILFHTARPDTCWYNLQQHNVCSIKYRLISLPPADSSSSPVTV